jgi:hypothetical protein
MAVATKRACRDCGVPLARTHLDSQCVECQGKTMWRPVTPGGFTPTVRELILEPSPPKPSACEQGKHPGCKHYAHLIAEIVEMNEGCAMCLVCGAADDDDGNRFTHKADCVFAPLEPPL